MDLTLYGRAGKLITSTSLPPSTFHLLLPSNLPLRFILGSPVPRSHVQPRQTWPLSPFQEHWTLFLPQPLLFRNPDLSRSLKCSNGLLLRHSFPSTGLVHLSKFRTISWTLIKPLLLVPRRSRPLSHAFLPFYPRWVRTVERFLVAPGIEGFGAAVVEIWVF